MIIGKLNLVTIFALSIQLKHALCALVVYKEEVRVQAQLPSGSQL
jgi:hypothetical protein